MIFVTVGTDLPFDRMLRVIDAWAGDSGRDDVFAQIGEGAWEPENIRFANFLQLYLLLNMVHVLCLSILEVLSVLEVMLSYLLYIRLG